MTKPDDNTREPHGQADILPFRSRPKPEPQPAPAAPAEDDNYEPLSTAALIKIAVLVFFLVVAGVWLMNKLRDIGKLEDCAMQGRRNCVTIPVPGRNQ
jgi:hypothetical protein